MEFWAIVNRSSLLGARGPDMRPPPCEGELSTHSDQAREDEDHRTVGTLMQPGR